MRYGLILLLGLLTQPLLADTAGPIVFNSANQHYYQLITTPGGILWRDAQAGAMSRSYKGMIGHLVSIPTPGVQEFVQSHLSLGSLRWWIGAYQIPNPSGLTDRNTPWNWVNGAPWVWTNWAPGEPNSQGTETAIEIHGAAQNKWYDMSPNIGWQTQGYIVEYEPSTKPGATGGPFVFQPMWLNTNQSTYIDIQYNGNSYGGATGGRIDGQGVVGLTIKGQPQFHTGSYTYGVVGTSWWVPFTQVYRIEMINYGSPGWCVLSTN